MIRRISLPLLNADQASNPNYSPFLHNPKYTEILDKFTINFDYKKAKQSKPNKYGGKTDFAKNQFQRIPVMPNHQSRSENTFLSYAQRSKQPYNSRQQRNNNKKYYPKPNYEESKQPMVENSKENYSKDSTSDLRLTDFSTHDASENNAQNQPLIIEESKVPYVFNGNDQPTEQLVLNQIMANEFEDINSNDDSQLTESEFNQTEISYNAADQSLVSGIEEEVKGEDHQNDVQEEQEEQEEAENIFENEQIEEIYQELPGELMEHYEENRVSLYKLFILYHIGQ